MAELYDEDTCCDYPTVNFYGAAQNADVATAEIARGYGMLAAKHNNIVDADGLVHCAVKDKDCSSVCDVDVRDKFADRPVSVHNADVISGRIERPAKQSLLLVHLKQWMTFRAERNDL